MSRWLQRFSMSLLIAGLIVGGLGWATASALRMEDNHLRAEAQKERAERMRHAMLKLDAFVASPLARENSRLFTHFTPLHSPIPAITRQGVMCEPGSVRLPSPLVEAELPNWMLLHFQCSPASPEEHRWISPQVIRQSLRDGLRKSPFSLTLMNVTPEREELLIKLRHEYSGERLLAEVQRHTRASEVLKEPAVDEKATNYLAANTAGRDGQIDVPKWNELNQGPQQQTAQGYADPDKSQRREIGNAARYTTPRGGRAVDPGMNLDSITAPKPSDVRDVQLTSMTAMWFPSPDQPDYLLYARLAQFGSQNIVQGVVVDWPKLRKELQEKIDELFPNSQLSPLPDDADPEADNVMSALPARLDAGAEPAPPAAGWTPLRIGLGVAWSAVLLALVAMGLSAYSLIDLSERRIRFVSAVTHELRTPLTTLRLYLDMLTSGLVRDPDKKDEYLHTLNSESERLHRLISNVLDFARLEKQSARPAPTHVPPAEILEQAKATWQSRCEAAGKELVIEDTLPANSTLHTDSVLVQQVLGNLIDNACKYSRCAQDRRVWLRALTAEAGRVAFEVEDCGLGVSRREWRSIFRPFRRGRDADVTAGGVGLGLALAKRWSAMLGGHLTITRGSRAGGACFRLELPT
jgi:signal transduction histidine kinase